MRFKIKTISDGPAASNTYICHIGQDAFMVDPGGSVERIKGYISSMDLELKFIFLTHAHYDHIVSFDKSKEAYPEAVSYIHEAETQALKDPVFNGSSFFGDPGSFAATDEIFKHGDLITFADTKIEIIHTPGHTRGSVCIRLEDVLFTGDTLFKLGIGRSDLPGGDEKKIYSSLSMLINMDQELRIYPGHGSISTIGYEKKNNPFIRDIYI